MTFSGKTALARALGQALQEDLHIISISGPDCFQLNIYRTEEYIQNIFTQATKNAPCLIIIDELNALVPQHGRSMENDACAAFLRCMDTLAANQVQVLVIGIVTEAALIETRVLASHRLGKIIHCPIPNAVTRRSILEHYLHKASTDLSIESITHLADHTAGCVGADLIQLTRTALVEHYHYPEMTLEHHLLQTLENLKPSVLQKTAHIVLKPMQFKNLFGLDTSIELLKTIVLRPLTDASAFDRLGGKPPRGILLYGPPGSGKSGLLAGIATAAAGRATILPVQCTELVSKVIGETEKALHALFTTARAAAPCILCLEQLDAIARPRGSDGSTENTFDRLLSTLLMEMDGATTPSNDTVFDVSTHVIVLATTEHPSRLDPAILRPGYVTYLIFFRIQNLIIL